jgi:putative ABC transport system permease protein
MWWRKRTQTDFRDEIDAHLQLEIDRLIAEGMSDVEAQSRARREFGSVMAAQERFYESQRWLWADHLRRDLRYAFRVLRKSPQLSLIAIVTMALGIGATSAIFTVVNAVLLRPLPYPEPDRLLMCVQHHTQFGNETVTLPDYQDWRAQSTRFETLGGAWNVIVNLTDVEEPERIAGAAVTADFRALGTVPQVGRVMANDEERNVVVLGHSVWQRRFASNADVVGKTVRLNGKPHTVIGVMPAGYAFPAKTELWIPLVPERSMNRGYHQLWVVGRLTADATIEQARSELSAIASRAERDYPDTNKNWGVQLSTLQAHVVGTSRRSLLVLAGAVGCLLLLACANVAGLLMSRSVSRRHEISVRAALGASRWQIVRQLLTESIVLATAGGVLGLGLAAWSIRPLLSLTTLPRTEEVSLDVTVALLTLLASVATGILFGLAPAAEALRRGDREELRVRGVHTVRLRPALVAFQVAVATMLLCGAGLLMRSFHRLHQVDTGFSGERVMTVRFFLPRASYSVERCVQLYQQMIERMKTLPGVESAAAVSSFPFSGVSANVPFEIPDRPHASGQMQTAEFRIATPGYFRTIGLPLISGRDLDSDSASSQFVAVVNRALVNRFFNGQDPIGRSVRILGPEPRTIVGVVGDLRHRGLDATVEPEIYIPHTQFPSGSMFLAVRTRLDNPLSLASGVRAELKALDPSLPIAQVQAWTELLDQTLSTRRFSLILLTIFSSVALALSVIGSYGMLSFHISQRTKEIGIRMAMGEAPQAVVQGAVRRGMLPVAMGLAVGLAGAAGTTHVLKSLLFEIRPTDPLTLATVGMLLIGAGFVACVLPARRAAGVDPMVALRHE